MSNEEKLRIVRLRPKIFCVGLNKTGTTSFGDAMGWLGCKTFGWRGDENTKLITDYFEGNKESMLREACNYDAFEDIPWPLMYKEFDEHFPNAKFVLTVRQTPEIWLDSIQRHIHKDYIGHELIYGYPRPSKNPEAYLNKYNEHNRNVIDYFADKPGKLLRMCFEDGDGWDKLLPFLGLKGTPIGPWPHKNKGRRQIRTPVRKKGAKRKTARKHIAKNPKSSQNR